ncbi:sulfurtransferase [Microvirga tunisiensis]|uniref:Sulfurtransferase n=1 Tax=Microvirga tunisiensis TaxID=2108360 RepID=A0A5N7MVM7_9HYPH|nr:sulfurtransferase [Microvirga tunisiensis]MPR13055.1 sulfurtransferase [Microvirga tunisiensis]MPR30948.1 sulfurtransferase [Microvirga tunisiensis]
MTTSPLVSVEWLSDHIADPSVLIVDIRSAEGGGQVEFAAGHIPGAVHSDYAADGWRIAKGGAGGLLPNAGHLSALLGRIGVKPGHHVVVVSAGEAASDFSAAARVYWTFRVAGHERVSVLDGGYRSWRDAGRPEEAGLSLPTASEGYPVRLTGSLRAEAEAVEKAVVTADATLLDGRSQAQFDGSEKSPQVVRAGHLPGAVHLDHNKAFRAGTGRLRPVAELEQLFEHVPAGPVISYCNTGHLASTNWFVLSEVLKRPAVTLYDGSMSEWTQESGRPVATNAS